MYWWIPALLVPIAQSISTYLDKRGLTKGKTSAFAFLLDLGIALLLTPLIFTIKVDLDLLPLVYLGAAIGAVGLYLAFRALKLGEMSYITPIMGSAGPLITWFVAMVLIGDTVSPIQFAGIIIIILGGLLLTYEEKNTQKRIPIKAIGFAIMAVTLYSFSSTIGKFLMNQHLGVWAYLVYTHWFATINLGFILLAKHRGEVSKVLKKTLSVDWRYLFGVIILTLTYRALQIYAVSLGPVSLVISMKRLSLPIAVILGGELLHEKDWKRKLLATIIMLIGVYLMVV